MKRVEEPRDGGGDDEIAVNRVRGEEWIDGKQERRKKENERVEERLEEGTRMLGLSRLKRPTIYYRKKKKNVSIEIWNRWFVSYGDQQSWFTWATASDVSLSVMVSSCRRSW